MNITSLKGMFEATRLTRAGRLKEATKFLRQMLQGRGVPRPAPPPADAAPRMIEFGHGEAETIEIADAAAAAAPPAAPVQESGIGRDGLGAMAGASMPPAMSALRSFLEQANQIGFLPPPGSLAFPEPAEDAPALLDGAKFLSASFSNPAGTRPYKLYVPSGYHGQPIPLIVMLHGCTQSPDDFAAGTCMNALAEEHVCLVVYPEQTNVANMSKCWNWFSPGDQRRDQGEPSLIAGITREVMSQYEVDPRRVYVAGLSAGGAAAAIMGAAYPDLFAAIGVHSGLACGAAGDLPSALATMRQGRNGVFQRRMMQPDAREGRRIVPAIVFHGDRDTTVHPSNGDGVVEQSTLSMPRETRVEEGRVTGGHSYIRSVHISMSGETLVEQWLIHGAGHAWSGGSPAGTYTDPHGPDASKEMLRFFLDHPLPADRPDPVPPC
ncbi:MAG TPA: PHB depolymerase family esterase [Acidocella sp.]|nr:PHB depolymerase family esterase [Acidocella sp.]